MNPLKSAPGNASRGASLVEYGLLAGLVAIVSIGSVSQLGDEVDNVFDGVRGELTAVAQDRAGDEVLSDGVGENSVDGGGLVGDGENDGSAPEPEPEPEPQPEPKPFEHLHTTWTFESGYNGRWTGVRSTFFEYNYGAMLNQDTSPTPVMMVADANEVRFAIEGDWGDDLNGLRTLTVNCPGVLSLDVADATTSFVADQEVNTQFWWEGESGYVFTEGEQFTCELS